jgi:predicted DNA-binding ribbon-helix-helix protein
MSREQARVERYIRMHKKVPHHGTIAAPSQKTLEFEKIYGEEAMCRIFAELNPDLYAYQTRSVRLGTHSTSVRLEAAFWTVLEEIAADQDMTLGRFLTRLHDEVLEYRGEMHNFSSLLRCVCLSYVGDIKRTPNAMALFAAQHRQGFSETAGKSGETQQASLHHRVE